MRGGHGKTWKFFHKIGHALATVGKDVDHYALGDFFKQASDGWKEEFDGVGDIFKHITKAKGWKELGEGLSDHIGDALEVAAPVAGTVANQFAHSMVHGQGFDQALENAGIALAGGAVGEAAGRTATGLMKTFGESEAGRALKGAIGKVMKRNPEKFQGIPLEEGGTEMGEVEGGERAPEDEERGREMLERISRQPGEPITAPTEEMPGLQRATPEVLNPGRGPLTEEALRREDILRGIQASSDSAPGFVDDFGDLKNEQRESYNLKKLRGRLYKKIPSRRALYKKIPTRKELIKGTKRQVVNLGKSIYRGIPSTMKEEGGKYLVERALRPLEGEQHFDMMHDGGSTGLGGDNPCPPGMVLRNGVCVPMK